MTTHGHVFLMAGALALAAATGCGDSSGDGDGDADGDNPVIDAAVGGPDATIGGPDAAVGTPDAAPMNTADAGPSTTVSFTRHTVQALMNSGPAYAAVADVVGDANLEIVVAAFGKPAGFTLPGGEVAIFERGASMDAWTKTVLVASADGIEFPGQPTVVDVDGDGDRDVIVPSGFLVCTAIPGGTPCGGLYWFERAGAAWVKHVIVENQPLFYHHVVLTDLDGDGIKDLITTGEDKSGFPVAVSKAELQWFKGTASGDRFEKTPKVAGAGAGSFPRLDDLDGDGDQDVISAEFFHAGGSFAWFENKGMGATWQRHVINNDSGGSIQLHLVPDLYGDGKLVALGANHTNTASNPMDPESAVFSFTKPADPKQPWPKTKISTGIVSRPNAGFAQQGAPGIFGVGDIDGDMDRDVLVSGDGDARVYWLEQKGVGMWATHVLEMTLGQAGGMLVVDLDGDGKNELVVTGYEDDKVYVYSRN